MNYYGQMALEHWGRYRPAGLATIEDPESFFWTLGEEIERRVDDRADALERLVPPDLPFAQRLARMSAARPDAQREVLAEMLPAAEEDETGE